MGPTLKPLLIMGHVLWISGALIVAVTVGFAVVSGGWGLLILSTPKAAIPAIGILAVAFGRYFVSKAKSPS